MNRAERRREGRRGAQTPTYNLTFPEIEALKKDATREAVEQMWILMMGFPLLVLHDHYGFGKKRLSDFVDKLIDTYKDYDDGYFTLQELLDVIETEGGVDLKDLKEALH